MEYDLSLSEALLGYELGFRHLDDRVVVVNSPPDRVTSPGDLVVVEGEGMPVFKDPLTKGDLYIKMNIIMPTPKELTPAVRKQLASILPQASRFKTSQDTDLAHYTAVPFDEEEARARAQKNKARSHHTPMDEDEEDESGARPSCRQQ